MKNDADRKFLPPSGCDLQSHLYSFSFNPNPYWSKQLCEQPEILQCKYEQEYNTCLADIMCQG